MALAGLSPDEYALHFLTTKGATYLAAAGFNPEVLRKEERWAGQQGYRPPVRSHGGDAAWVSNVLRISFRKRGVVQPWQGTRWGAPDPPAEKEGYVQERLTMEGTGRVRPWLGWGGGVEENVEISIANQPARMVGAGRVLPSARWCVDWCTY